MTKEADRQLVGASSLCSVVHLVHTDLQQCSADAVVYQGLSAFPRFHAKSGPWVWLSFSPILSLLVYCHDLTSVFVDSFF